MRRCISGPRRPGRARIGQVEFLESRTCLSLTVQLDYSQDVLGFFNDRSRRDLLQRAADTIASRLEDRLLAIVPSGSNTWTASTTNPGTGASLSVNNLAVPADTMIIYAGGRPLSGSTLGIGGPGGYSGSGSDAWLDLLEGRGQSGALATPATDQGPWGGSVTFNSNTKWHFGLDPSGLDSSEADFLSVALHELGHVFGFGINVWQNLVTGGQFRGPEATAAYGRSGSSPPVSGQHWAEGLTSDSQEVAMDPTITMGQRKLLTKLDFAALDDIGWQVSADPDGTRAGARDASVAAGTSRTFASESLDNRTDVDFFRLTARRTDVLDVGTFAVSGGIPVDTYLRLFDSSGRELASANNALYDELSYTFTADGTYYLGVSASPNRYYTGAVSPSRLLAGSTGNYALVVALNQDATAPAPSPSPAPVPTPVPIPTPAPAPAPTPPPADTTPPVIVGARADSVVLRLNPRARPQRVAVIFVTLSEPLDPSSATNPGAYVLMNGRTIRRRGLVFDRRAAIQRVSYIPGATGLMLIPARTASTRQPRILTIPPGAGLRDLAGNLLDGDGDGQPGGNFSVQV